MPASTPQQRQIWLIFFFLGIIMLNFPFLQIFNRLETVLGIPLLAMYFLVGWPASIGVVYFFCRTLERNDSHFDA
ncbi:MAG: hypothetical protein RBR02_09080 [Desulfuromonadaceae bacterium]|nr:hypothetical protein [Desulfuromonadaceae bacterium]